MRKPIISFASAALIVALSSCSGTPEPVNVALPVAPQLDGPAKPPSTPSEFIAGAKAEEWLAIAPSDLLVMNLAPDAKGKTRRVVIQLMPAPFSQGWVGNIKKLAAAHWWDGTSINRVQDNYVVQWGDATEKKELPKNLAVVPESEYVAKFKMGMFAKTYTSWGKRDAVVPNGPMQVGFIAPPEAPEPRFSDAYSVNVGFASGFPIGMTYIADKDFTLPGTKSEFVDGTHRPDDIWPVHCYGMVGVGRNLSPDTGTGAELYTVIGHAPRHLDRNIAVVGRIIEGMEHLSSLPRGTGTLGFYETEGERVPIESVRLASELKPDADLKFEYLSTESASFAGYANARANRKDDFFNVPAGGADICNIPVPVRRHKD